MTINLLEGDNCKWMDKMLEQGIKVDLVVTSPPYDNIRNYNGEGNLWDCEIFKQDTMVLVTDIQNKKYKNGITRQNLLQASYLMCNFALQDVGQFIRNLFPKYHQFSLEIDDCSKIIPFLLGQKNYTFLPKDMAEPYLETKKLRVIPLVDFQTPVINSYIICKKSKLELCKKIFL